jgi:hypothetical protein
MFAYNGDFENKMHYILEVLKLESLYLCCFGINILACIGLDYYTTNNNTFTDIVMNNLIKLYITCACSSIQNYNFQKKSPFYFLKSFQLSTSKNENKNLQPPRRKTRTFNL